MRLRSSDALLYQQTWLHLKLQCPKMQSQDMFGTGCVEVAAIQRRWDWDEQMTRDSRVRVSTVWVSLGLALVKRKVAGKAQGKGNPSPQLDRSLGHRMPPAVTDRRTSLPSTTFRKMAPPPSVCFLFLLQRTGRFVQASPSLIPESEDKSYEASRDLLTLQRAVHARSPFRERNL